MEVNDEHRNNKTTTNKAEDRRWVVKAVFINCNDTPLLTSHCPPGRQLASELSWAGDERWVAIGRQGNVISGVNFEAF